MTVLLGAGMLLLGAPGTGHAAPAGPSGPPAAPSVGYNWDQTATPPTAAQRQRGIDEILTRMPGARQLDARTVELQPGLRMKFRDTAEERATGEFAAAAFVCNVGNTCAYSDRQYGGEELNFYYCSRRYNLGNVPFPGGGWWNDKISSIKNNQTSGTWSYFYNYVGGGSWKRILSLKSGNQLSNLALDKVEGGTGSPNDMIDGVHTCGAVPSPWTPNYP